MIGILGGMGTQASLDFCNKLAILNRGKSDQKYPMFILYNKSKIPKRPENLKKYHNVLKSLIADSVCSDSSLTDQVIIWPIPFILLNLGKLSKTAKDANN